MKVFSETVALAWPNAAQDIDASVRSLADVRNGKTPVEVRIGVGPLHGDIPLRVLGYAGCVAETLQRDVRTLIEPTTPRIVLFSSAPKAGPFDAGVALRSLVALAGALRLALVTHPIKIEVAAGHSEIPADLNVDLPPQVAQWVMERAARHKPNEPPSFQYAFEHASASMFGDIAETESAPFRVTVGGATEARFWAVRVRVRDAAAASGARLAPAAGVIMRAIKVPWYQPLACEPRLADAHTPAAAAAALAQAANPSRGGNQALKREARAAERLVHIPGISALINATGSAPAALRFAQDNGFEVGTRLMQAIGDIHES